MIRGTKLVIYIHCNNNNIICIHVQICKCIIYNKKQYKYKYKYIKDMYYICKCIICMMTIVYIPRFLFYPY